MGSSVGLAVSIFEEYTTNTGLRRRQERGGFMRWLRSYF